MAAPRSDAADGSLDAADGARKVADDTAAAGGADHATAAGGRTFVTAAAAGPLHGRVVPAGCTAEARVGCLPCPRPSPPARDAGPAHILIDSAAFPHTRTTAVAPPAPHSRAGTAVAPLHSRTNATAVARRPSSAAPTRLAMGACRAKTRSPFLALSGAQRGGYTACRPPGPPARPPRSPCLALWARAAVCEFRVTTRNVFGVTTRNVSRGQPWAGCAGRTSGQRPSRARAALEACPERGGRAGRTVCRRASSACSRGGDGWSRLRTARDDTQGDGDACEVARSRYPTKDDCTRISSQAPRL